MIIFVVLVFIFIFIYEAPELVEKEYWRELAVFTLLLLLGLVLSSLLVSGVKLPYIETVWIELGEGIHRVIQPGL
ncbi:MAG TPA: hypothetical protein DDZ55_02965 [Firmicutes bacterium]|nr:hypothetical protein [Bacillota bacterium]